jgi:protein nanos 1
MLCKVCKDTGKSASVFNSHSVRDANGQVVCPTLLKQNCTFCKKAGHTAKYCPKLKGKYNPNHQKTTTTTQKTTNTPKKEEPVAATTTIHEQEQQQQFRRRARELCSSPPPPSTTTTTTSNAHIQRARELCSSPPPPPPSKTTTKTYKAKVIPFVPTPVGEKANYFHLLSVDENNKETTTFGKLSDNYLEIAKERVEAANREREETKEVELKKHRKNLHENFPALGGEKQEHATVVMPTPNPVWHATTRPTDNDVPIAKREREDSPPPSPVSSQPPEAPPAPKKMPKVSEETSTPPPPPSSSSSSASSYQAPPVLRWADYDD